MPLGWTRIFGILALAGLAAGCLQLPGLTPRPDCERSASWGASSQGSDIVALGAAQPRSLAQTARNDFEITQELALREGETAFRGNYGPPIQTGRLELAFIIPPGASLHVAVGFCGNGGLPYTCTAPAEGPGVAGEGDGFGFTVQASDEGCRFTLQLNPARFGSRDVLRWEATVDRADAVDFTASTPHLTS